MLHFGSSVSKELSTLVFTTPFPFPWLVSTAVVLTAIYSNPEHILALKSQCRHEATAGMSPVIGRTPSNSCRWHRRNDCVSIKDRKALHTLTISRTTAKFQRISIVRIYYTLPWPSVSIKEKHHCTRCTRQGDMDAQRRLEIPDTQQWKAVVAT